MAPRRLRVLAEKEMDDRDPKILLPHGLVPAITGPDGEDGVEYACGRCGHVLMQGIGPKTPLWPNWVIECFVCHAYNDIDFDFKTPLH